MQRLNGSYPDTVLWKEKYSFVLLPKSRRLVYTRGGLRIRLLARYASTGKRPLWARTRAGQNKSIAAS